MVEEVWSRRGSRGEIGYPEIIWFGQVCTSLAQHLSREVLQLKSNRSTPSFRDHTPPAAMYALVAFTMCRDINTHEPIGTVT